MSDAENQADIQALLDVIDDPNGDGEARPMVYRPLSVEDLGSLKTPPREDIVEGGMLVAGSVTLFTAREKAGKTMFATDLACSVALEEPFLDRAVVGGPVIFVALEENIREVRDRIMTRLAGRREACFYVLPANGFDGVVFRIDIGESVAALRQMICDYSAKVVIVDTFREAHRQRENESDDMGPLLRPLREIAHETNCAIVLLHHESKTGGSRGSTAIAAAADQLWRFQRTDDQESSDSPKGRFSVEGRFGPPFSIGIRLGDGVRWLVDDAAMVVDPTLHTRVLAFIKQSPVGSTASEIAGGLDANLKSVQNEIARLLKEAAPPIVSSGSGHKGDPRRYRLVSPELFVTCAGYRDVTNVTNDQSGSSLYSGNNVTNAWEGEL